MKLYVKILFLTAAAFLILSSVYATTMKDISVKELASMADEIVVGECVEKESQWVGGHIETTFKIKVSEVWKGSKKAGENLEITQPGGELKTKPIGQYIPGMPTFYKGEKTVLFLDTKPVKLDKKLEAKHNPKSKILVSPKVVAGNKGKWTVVADEKTGKQFAVRYNLEKINLVTKDNVNQKIDKALAAREKMLSEGTLKNDNIALSDAKAVEMKKNSGKSSLPAPKTEKETAAKTTAAKTKAAEDKKDLDKQKFNLIKDSVKELDILKSEVNECLKK